VTVSGRLESLFPHEYDRGLRALFHRRYAATAPVPGGLRDAELSPERRIVPLAAPEPEAEEPGR
jgi:hypothetical protein